ncbi:MAG: amino acid ABC transporter substrate-binding protein [Lachnospiraceae bacterium]|nr:amino acid ABC transporter substrate-binding protein [Lachnospiraceae bacterium]
MKKYFALLLAGVMALSLAACGGSSSAPAAPAETQKEETAAEAPAEEKAEAEAPAAEAPAAEEAAAEIKTVEAGKLHMATNAAFPPYEMISDNGGFEGIDVEIATLIAQKLGLELVVDDMEFGSVITSVQGGKSDIAMAGLTVTDERKQNVDFTESYATGVQVIIVPEGSDIQTVDDLANNKMIGVQDGTTGYIYCSSPVEDGGYGEDHVTSYPNGAMAIEALKGGKVDAVVIDNEPAKAFVQANAGLKILDTEYIVENYAIGISKDNNGLRDAVNNALKELIADGSVQLIVDKYINAEK